jgi:hypothetical protein
MESYQISPTIAEIVINPISLNEWTYLFSTLSLEQLNGENIFFVKLDNGNIGKICQTLEKGDSGPDSLNFDIEAPYPIRLPRYKRDRNPRIIIPVASK